MLAILTIHHWSDLAKGLNECARVSKRRIIIFTWDPGTPGFWLTREYFPEILEFDRNVFPSMGQLRDCLGQINVRTIPIPGDCVDGFLGAYWCRPEAYLNGRVRSGVSSFSRVAASQDGIKRLATDLSTGMWKRANKNLLKQDSADIGYRLVTAAIY